MRERGLFEPRPAFDILNVAFAVGLIGLTVGLLLSGAPFMTKLLGAAIFAFITTQVGFVAHDAGHRQVFRRPFRNDLLLLSLGPLMGLSRSWWVDNHNAHHSNPNDLTRDPHTAIPAFAFSEEQARSKRGIMRLVTPYQAFYFFPMLLFQGIGIRIASVQHVLAGKARYPLAEAFVMVLHVLLYAALLLSVMAVWQATAFFLIHQGLMGLYMGSVFAPNHKGMALLDPDARSDFLHEQILTTRNIRPHPVTDFLFGGLNYQIEHHLFPNLPRNNLKAAREVVRSFCAERSIPYHETGVLGSYREVLTHLRLAGRAAV